MRLKSILLLASAAAAACGVDASGAQVRAPGPDATVGHGAMKLGAAIHHGHLWDAAEPAYESTFAREFDSLTP